MHYELTYHFGGDTCLYVHLSATEQQAREFAVCIQRAGLVADLHLFEVPDDHTGRVELAPGVASGRPSASSLRTIPAESIRRQISTLPAGSYAETSKAIQAKVGAAS
jgi:hypothetical protein